MVIEPYMVAFYQELQGSWHRLDTEFSLWITLDLAFRQVFMATFPALTGWLMMSSSIIPKSKVCQVVLEPYLGILETLNGDRIKFCFECRFRFDDFNISLSMSICCLHLRNLCFVYFEEKFLWFVDFVIV